MANRFLCFCWLKWGEHSALEEHRSEALFCNSILNSNTKQNNNAILKFLIS